MAYKRRRGSPFALILADDKIDSFFLPDFINGCFGTECKFSRLVLLMLESFDTFTILGSNSGYVYTSKSGSDLNRIESKQGRI